MYNKKIYINLGRFAINNFIPTVWAAEVMTALETRLVYAQEGIVNRDYEGEISAFGDTVKINGIGAVTIGNYVKNTDMDVPEVLNDNTRSLVIDQAKYFNFLVDDIDQAQQNPKVMQQAMANAAYGLKKVADGIVAGVYTGANGANLIGDDTTPTTLTAVTQAYDRLVDLNTKLDEADIPDEGRWVVVPSWFEGLLLKDSRFITAGGGADAAKYNGLIGEAAGFRVLKSNQVPNVAGAKFKVMAGHPMAISYAEQIVSVEAYRPERRFADAVKGLHLYGTKLVRPEALAVMTVNRPAL